jgi:hypothetical protein
MVGRPARHRLPAQRKRSVAAGAPVPAIAPRGVSALKIAALRMAARWGCPATPLRHPGSRPRARHISRVWLSDCPVFAGGPGISIERGASAVNQLSTPAQLALVVPFARRANPGRPNPGSPATRRMQFPVLENYAPGCRRVAMRQRSAGGPAIRGSVLHPTATPAGMLQ